MSSKFIYYGLCDICEQHGDKLPRDVNEQRLCREHAHKPSPPTHSGITQDLLRTQKEYSGSALASQDQETINPDKDENLNKLMNELEQLNAQEPINKTKSLPQIAIPPKADNPQTDNRLKNLEAAAENQYNTAVQFAADIKRHSQKIADAQIQGKKLASAFQVKQQIIQENAEDIERLQNNHRGLGSAIKKNTLEIDLLKEQVGNNSQLIKTIEKSLNAGKSKFAALEKALKALQQLPKLKPEDISELQEMVRSFNSKVNEVAELKSEVITLQKAGAKHEEANKDTEKHLDRLRQISKDLREDRQQILDKIHEFQKKSEEKIDDFKTSSNETIDFMLNLARKIMNERNLQVENATRRTAKNVTKKLTKDKEEVNELKDAIKNLEERKFKNTEKNSQIGEVQQRITELYNFIEKSLDKEHSEKEKLRVQVNKLQNCSDEVKATVDALPKLNEMKKAIQDEIEIPEDFVSQNEFEGRLKTHGDGLINKMQKITGERDTEAMKKHLQFKKDIHASKEKIEQLEEIVALQNNSIKNIKESQTKLANATSEQQKQIDAVTSSLEELTRLIARQAVSFAAVLEQNKSLLAHNRQLSLRISEIEGKTILNFQESL